MIKGVIGFFRRRKQRRDTSRALRMALYHFYEDHGYDFPPWLTDFCEGEPRLRMYAFPFLTRDLLEKGWPRECEERMAIERAGLGLIGL